MLSTLPNVARWGFGGGWAGPWWPMMIVFWLLVIAISIWAFRRIARSNRSDSATALQILEARYARGEIDTDDYRARRDELRGLG